MEQHIEDFIWDSFDELSHLFPPKVAQRLHEQKNTNKRFDFGDDLSVIFSMDDTILENITKEYRQKLESMDSIEGITTLLSKYPYSQEYLAKAQKWIDEDKVSQTMGNLLNTIGYAYHLQGNYSKALEFFQKSLAIYEEVLGTKHHDTATSYNNIGLVYQSKGEYNQALEFYQKSLVIREEALGTNHPNTAQSYNNIGEVYYAKGEYDKALEFFQKSLAVREKVLGMKHQDTASSYNNIGGVYYYKGEFDKALEFYQKSLAIREEVLGTNHPDTAQSYNNIGGVYKYKGKYDKALEFFQKSLVIYEKVLGTKHHLTATSYNNIGLVYNSKGEYDKALEFYQKSLAVREKVLGMKHQDTASSYNNIGVVYEAKGEYDKALRFLQKSLTIREEVLGTKHPDTAQSYNNIGGVYYYKGEFDKALEFYQKALRININIYGTAHQNSEIVYSNMIAFKNNFFVDSSHLGKALYLDGVHIENFKLLKNFEMSFTQGVNIIIGENSSGKTSLLQAITLGLMKKGSFDDFNDFEKYITKTKSESKINLYFDEHEKHTTLKSNAREVDNNILSPFVVAYGSNIFTKYKLEADNIVNDMLSGNIRRDFTTSIFQDYTDKIHNPKSILNKLSELARNGDKKADDYEVIFKKTINYFIEGFDLIKDEQSKQYIFRCSTEGNHFRLENLSEGYRNSVLLIGDILVKVLGVGEKPNTIEGVILIDEFDRHLHPKWQSNLVSKLTKIFPKIQFILTTHNPMSVMDKEGNEITVLREIDGKLIAIKESGTKNIDVCTVLLKYFSVESTISQSMKKKVDDFNRLKLKKILSNEEEQTLRELEEFLGQTVASNFIYDSKYLQFLEFIKEHTEIDFEKYNQISEEEAQELLEKFKGFFDD